MSSWSSRIFHKSAPIHNSHSGLGGNPAPQINHDPHLLTSPALPPHLRPPSSASALSSSASTTHPYSMVSTPHQYNSAHDMDDEGECPVCLEPLSFSFRLPGEKPHIVPECGHALHEACFSAVYGPPPTAGRAGLPRKSNLGVCGVCRRPMKVPDGDGGKSNKLAALTGTGDRNPDRFYPGKSASAQPAYDPSDDDPLDHASSLRNHRYDGSSSQGQYIVAPSISVRSEFANITRLSAPVQPLTCIVIVELPSRRQESEQGTGYRTPVGGIGDLGSPTESTDPSLRRIRKKPSVEGTAPGYYATQTTPVSTAAVPPYEGRGRQYNSSSSSPGVGESPFQSITEDLMQRISDWKGHPMSGLGPLQMFDILSVRRDVLVREFYVYLFKEAIICVLEEKKKSLGRLLSGEGASISGGVTGGGGPNNKGVLRLKGRIYIRHIRRVHDTSSAGELSLTIDMEDERLESFILIFRDRGTLESWKSNISTLVQAFQASQGRGGTADLDEFGGVGQPMPKGVSAKAQRMLSGSTGTTSNSDSSSIGPDSLLGGGTRSPASTSTSPGMHPSNPYAGGGYQGGTRLAKIPSEEQLGQYTPTENRTVTPHVATGRSNNLTPLQHAPLDLILVISVPPPSAAPATAALKVRVIKTTLDFVLAQLGAKDRLSLVTFEVGVGGRVRKTPFLSLGKFNSRERLQGFIDRISAPGQQPPDGMDEFLVRNGAGPEEKTDVVTAVNHGLDVVLQRKAKNSVSGMVLVSDASDSTRRAQMDLVLARAEAANVPIHSFGYGRSHDPASLWLISNHTSGTYTFVKDWYDLRDCLAGCLGGLMSIGLVNMKLHMKIVDSHRFRIRKCSGGPNAIVASDGKDVHVEVGELRYGERKEMLVELELDNHHDLARIGSDSLGDGGVHNRELNATDQFVASMGLDALSLGDGANLMDGMMERMIDEVPVFEVDGSFYDPAASTQVSRLAHPVLLTVTLLPLQHAARHGNQSPQQPPSDPVIVRRRMELLASDMITRALVLVSRKNYGQAQRIMAETKRILHTVLQNITQSLPPPSAHGSTVRNRKELLTLSAVRALQAVLQDIQALMDALDENVEMFSHDQRNFGAQQAMILRDQKSWSGRTATEKVFWTVDNSVELVGRSADWVARD